MKKILGVVVVIAAITVIGSSLSQTVDVQPAQSSRVMQQNSSKQIGPATDNSGATKTRNVTPTPTPLSEPTETTPTSAIGTGRTLLPVSGSTTLSSTFLVNGVPILIPETILTPPPPTTIFTTIFSSNHPDRLHCTVVGNTVTYGWQEWQSGFPRGRYTYKPGAKVDSFTSASAAESFCDSYNYQAGWVNP